MTATSGSTRKSGHDSCRWVAAVWATVAPAGAVARSSQCASPSGGANGVSIRFAPCSVATPVSSVSGVRTVLVSE